MERTLKKLMWKQKNNNLHRHSKHYLVNSHTKAEKHFNEDMRKKHSESKKDHEGILIFEKKLSKDNFEVEVVDMKKDRNMDLMEEYKEKQTINEHKEVHHRPSYVVKEKIYEKVQKTTKPEYVVVEEKVYQNDMGNMKVYDQTYVKRTDKTTEPEYVVEKQVLEKVHKTAKPEYVVVEEKVYQKDMGDMKVFDQKYIKRTDKTTEPEYVVVEKQATKPEYVVVEEKVYEKDMGDMKVYDQKYLKRTENKPEFFVEEKVYKYTNVDSNMGYKTSKLQSIVEENLFKDDKVNETMEKKNPTQTVYNKPNKMQHSNDFHRFTFKTKSVKKTTLPDGNGDNDDSTKDIDNDMNNYENADDKDDFNRRIRNKMVNNVNVFNVDTTMRKTHHKTTQKHKRGDDDDDDDSYEDHDNEDDNEDDDDNDDDDDDDDDNNDSDNDYFLNENNDKTNEDDKHLKTQTFKQQKQTKSNHFDDDTHSKRTNKLYRHSKHFVVKTNKTGRNQKTYEPTNHFSTVDNTEKAHNDIEVIENISNQKTQNQQKNRIQDVENIINSKQEPTTYKDDIEENKEETKKFKFGENPNMKLKIYENKHFVETSKPHQLETEPTNKFYQIKKNNIKVLIMFMKRKPKLKKAPQFLFK